MKKTTLHDVMNQRKPLSHIVFILFSLIVAVWYVLSGRDDSNAVTFISLFFLLSLQLEVFIFFGNLLFASFNFERSPGVVTRMVIIRFTLFIAICLTASFVLYMLTEYSNALIKGKDLSEVFPAFWENTSSDWFKSTLTGLSFGAVIFIVILWQAALHREQKLKEENLIFLNETLKNQVNPHFLFNSLNTLSSLIATSPDTAEQFIQKLSSIYRYILENSRKDRILLTEELEFIDNYFGLFRIRDEGKIFLVIDAADADKYSILPVSLQILVENAIKHNMATRENPLTISIFTMDNNVVVENNLQTMATSIKSTRIGLKNLGERVRIITGRDLVIEETPTRFIAKLPLLT
ncbi:MAG TPA: histidine kinase [Bacteroidales bacterium]|nr:histidine kinase [Bacteroidales bacterium]